MTTFEKTPIMLITGASRGIGRAVALQAAALGYNLCLNYRRDSNAASTVLAEVEKLGAKAIVVKADVALEADVMRLFETTDQELGTLDVLINNAGMLFQSTRLEEYGPERINQVLSTNVTGSMLCAREAVRRMSTKHGGSGGNIVNLSSMAALLGSPNEFIDYAASKGAIDSMTIGLAKEVASEGIRVNAVRPGLIHTDIHESAGDPDRVARMQSGVPMQRGGSADEVANAIIWLASDQASYVTATFINVSGGR